jgi:hypothetical protein
MKAAPALVSSGHVDGFLLNPWAQRQSLVARAPVPGFGPADAATAKAVIARFPSYAPTPLVELPELAKQFGVGTGGVVAALCWLGLSAARICRCGRSSTDQICRP